MFYYLLTLNVILYKKISNLISIIFFNIVLPNLKNTYNLKNLKLHII